MIIGESKLKTIDTDILIIGTGGAGLRAALSARDENPDLKITAISRVKAGKHGVTAIACSDRMAFHVSFPFTDAETTGQAWVDHAKDIYEGGGFVSDPNLADTLAKNSADAFDRLEKLGVPFVMKDDGIPDQFVTDGSKFPRACYTGPYTARDIQNAQFEAVKKTDIELLDNLLLASFLKDESGVISSLLCVDEKNDDWITIRCKAAIIASGGPGDLFESSVFPERMDPSPWFAAIRAGAKLVNLEFIQFGLSSPKTGLACSGSLMRALPKLISDGADLLPAVGDLSPDENPLELLFYKGASWPISSESKSRAVDLAVWNARSENKKVVLDYRENPDLLSDPTNLPDSIKHWYESKGIDLVRDGKLIPPIERLRAINPQVIEWFNYAGVDLEKEPLEIRHAAQHYQGGILINTKAETGVPGLYACGEAAGGQHGANRPGGNALMDSQVMGHIAGIEAAKFCTDKPDENPPVNPDNEIEYLENFLSTDGGIPPNEAVKIIRRNLSMNLSLKRSSERLNDAEEIFSYLFTNGIDKSDSSKSDNVVAVSSMVIGMALTRCAKSRNESRGPHFYFEHEDDILPSPRKDPDGRYWNTVEWENIYLIVTRGEIPKQD